MLGGERGILLLDALAAVLLWSALAGAIALLVTTSPHLMSSAHQRFEAVRPIYEWSDAAIDSARCARLSLPERATLISCERAQPDELSAEMYFLYD